MVYVTMIGYFLTPFYNFSLEHPLVHDLTHLHFLISGAIFWWVIIGKDPSRWRLSFPGKLGLLATGIPVTAVLGLALTGDRTSIAPHFHTVADTRAGGSILWIFGELTMLDRDGPLALPMDALRRARSGARRPAGRPRGGADGRRGLRRLSAPGSTGDGAQLALARHLSARVAQERSGVHAGRAGFAAGRAAVPEVDQLVGRRGRCDEGLEAALHRGDEVPARTPVVVGGGVRLHQSEGDQRPEHRVEARQCDVVDRSGAHRVDPVAGSEHPHIPDSTPRR